MKASHSHWARRLLHCKREPFLIKELQQGVTKKCRLSWLTNSALVYEPKCGGWGRVAGPQPMIDFFPIPDPVSRGSKRAPDPGSGSATLEAAIMIER